MGRKKKPCWCAEDCSLVRLIFHLSLVKGHRFCIILTTRSLRICQDCFSGAPHSDKWNKHINFPEAIWAFWYIFYHSLRQYLSSPLHSYCPSKKLPCHKIIYHFLIYHTVSLPVRDRPRLPPHPRDETIYNFSCQTLKLFIPTEGCQHPLKLTHEDFCQAKWRYSKISLSFRESLYFWPIRIGQRMSVKNQAYSYIKVYC